ncbi:DUF2938 family protein [Novosphingobium panipatense]|uniref:DUF2938 family protein n=1 Tax=Novosphingobium panipatense TaxID=428991 RepID=UPI003622C5BA
MIARQPRFIIAALCGAVSYMLMNFLMTAAPLAMRMCGHSQESSNLGLQWHVIAMYAPSFFTGRLITRFGAGRVVAVGLALIGVSSAVGLAGIDVAHFWATLILLGVGWNFGFIGASALVLECHRPEEKTKVQALNDFLVFGTMAVGSFVGRAARLAWLEFGLVGVVRAARPCCGSAGASRYGAARSIDRKGRRMTTMEIIVRAALVGIGGTIILDIYAALVQRFIGTPATNWRMVGRWIGHMPQGQFIQFNLGRAKPVPGEHALGWIFHYVIGVGYGLLLVTIWGTGWLEAPTIVPPLILALTLLVLPYFVMMPGMGMGMAGSRTPKPNVTRLKSVIGHSVFGSGMYFTAQLLETAA